MSLSHDAIIFGLGYLNGPSAKLSFGGEGAKLAITERARNALNELLSAGYAEPAEPTDQITGREHYRGCEVDPHIGQLAQSAKIDPFNVERWVSFKPVGKEPTQ